MKIFAIIQKEFYSLFVSPIAYVILTMFALLNGYFFVVLLLYSRSSEIMPYIFGNTAVIMMLICPLITMRMFSEEQSLRTEEILFTCPVRLWEIILGKFLSCCVFFLITISLTLPSLAALIAFGTPDIGPIISGYIGIILLGFTFNSIGIFTSSLTKNQIVSAVMSFSILLLLWVIGWSGDISSGETLKSIVSTFSLLNHFQSFERGVIELTDIYFYCSFIIVFLFFTHRVIYLKNWK